jgi:hypothetical protein
MLIKPAAAALTLVALSATVVAVSSAFDRSSAAAAASKPPATVTATPLPADKPPFSRSGTIVSSSKLGVRVFVNDKNGFALATLAIPGVTYPAATVNGGKTWRIDRPHFHVAAANAPNVVTQVGAAGPATYFAYGGPGGGNSACVTSDGGKHWWRAYLPGTPVAIVYSHVTSPGELVAWVERGPGQFWVYVSSDGGHHWRYHKGSI